MKPTPCECDRCGRIVDLYPFPAYMGHDMNQQLRWLPASLMLDPEPSEFGDILVGEKELEFPHDPDALRREGVPLRTNHDHTCPRPKTVQKRVWTKGGWRSRSVYK